MLIGVFLLLQASYVSLILLLLAGTILTGLGGLEFDRAKKKYREYNSFFFLKFGNWLEYDSVEMIFINASNVSQKIYTMVTTGVTARNVEYDAYLKFGNGIKVCLMSARNKNSLFKKLATVSDFFQLDVVDNTL